MPRDTEFNLDDSNSQGGDVPDIYDDGNGGFTDADGNPVDADGQPIEPEDRGDEVLEDDPDANADGKGEPTPDDELDPDLLDELAGGKSKTVPITRLNEVLDLNRQLMDIIKSVPSLQAAPVKEDKPKEPTFDLAAKLKERNAKLTDGDEEGALALDLEIEEYRISEATTRAQANAIKAVTQQNEQNAVQAVADAAVVKYPFLETDNDAMDEVMMYRDHFFKKGASLSVALSKAVEKVCPAKAKELGFEDDPPADKEDKPGKSKPRVLSLAELRKARAVKRNVGVEQRQPPRVNGTGNPNSRTINPANLNIEDMPDEEFNALPEEVKAKLRGDTA
jgi:hypothetical protein